MFHTLSWVAWLIAAAVPAFTLRNPLYLALVLGAAWLVYTALGRTSPIGYSWGTFARIGFLFLALAVPFNALSNHIGQIVLFRLPANWPIIGGPITLEATIAGAVNGLGLLTILIVFAAFNAVVDHYQLLRATPPFLFPAGVVVSIAITFVPQMVLSAREIHQAQRIRGHRFRGVRDLLPLVMPLLANALERAIQLAETMEARGFGRIAAPFSRRQAMTIQLATLIGLLSLLTGLSMLAYLPGYRLWGRVLTIAGVGGLLGVFGVQGRQVHRTRYRQSAWHWQDTVIALSCALVLTALIVARLTAPSRLAYNPFPPGPLLPPFNLPVGAALLLLALPALLSDRGQGAGGRME